ncbi:hypothetical protein MTO96_033198 [Rhipicephalus appendiculatus]
MPTRHAKPRGDAERGALAASSRPKRSAAPARTPTDNDPELAKDIMDTDDQDIETQVSSAADAEDYFLSPDEVSHRESTSDAGSEDKDSAEESNEEAKNGVTIVQARMLGKSETAVITFDGPILPRFVYYYGGEMPCVPYQPTRQYCKLCKSQGHRTDVCPTPMTKACSNCRLRDPPEDHTCEPECALCGGDHPTAASECTKKLKRVPQRGRPPLSHKHSTPQTYGILKRRWFSTDREDSAPPGEARSSSRSRSRSTSRSRSGSRDGSNSRNGDHKRAQTKQQQHKGKKVQNRNVKNKVKIEGRLHRFKFAFGGVLW